MGKSHEIIIGVDGTTRFVHSDSLKPLAQELGKATTRRASHVEPTGSLSETAKQWLARHGLSPHDLDTALADRWWADLYPVQGPVLGPFDTHQAAIDAELAWLHEHQLPLPR